MILDEFTTIGAHHGVPIDMILDEFTTVEENALHA
jgi:hypothetical protein